MVTNPDDVLGVGGVFSMANGTTYKPFEYAILISFPWYDTAYGFQVLVNLSSGHNLALRCGSTQWSFIDYL